MLHVCNRFRFIAALSTVLLCSANAHDQPRPVAPHNADQNQKDPATMIELQLSHNSNDNTMGHHNRGFVKIGQISRELSGVLQPTVSMQPANMSLQDTPHHRLHNSVLNLLGRVQESRTVRGAALGPLTRRLQLPEKTQSELQIVLDRFHNKTSAIGLIIFAQGRTGTSSLAETIRESIGMHYCFDEKESFEIINISSTALRHCSVMHGSYRSGWFAHVKPWHIRRNYPFKHPDLQKLSPMTFSKFFRTARASDFSLVLSVFRFNQLERYISAFELLASHDPELQRTAHRRKGGTPVMQSNKWKALTRKHFLEFDLEATFLRDAHEFVNGTNAALEAGFPVAFMDMGQYVGKMLCPAVKSLFEQMRNISYGMASAKHEQVPFLFNQPFKCKKTVLQTGSSHPHWKLEHRVGLEAAAAVKSQLAGTQFQWMLDLSAFKRPEYAPRPSFQIPPPGVILMHPQA